MRSRLLEIVLIGSGLVTILGIGPYNLIREYSSRSWPTVEGQVQSAEVVEVRKKRERAWEPRVTYTYEVAGTSYQSDTIWLGGSKSRTDASFAQDFVAAHPVGGAVEVYHDPDDPTTSSLVVGDVLRGWLIELFGVVLMGAGVWMLRDRK